MKKAIRTPKKSRAPQKTVSGKSARAKAEAIKAFQLVCGLIAVSICISFAVIIAYNNSKRNDVSGTLAEETALFIETTEQREQPATQTVPAASAAPVQPEVVLQEESKPSPIASTSSPPLTPAPVSPPAPAITQTPVSATTPIRPPISAANRCTQHMGSIAFVIDDAGNNLQELEPFLRIEGPLTIAVLPGLPHSAEAARRIRAAGKEVILHQPMEALGGQNPGPSAIYSNMTAEQIRTVLEKNIEEIGPVAGMNNHQGSKITQNREIMEIILAFCAENSIYFLDSRTTAETAVPAAARRLGMTIAQRDTFLDNEPDKESMQRYLTTGLARAQRHGISVMIGHTHSRALAPLLAEQYPILTIQGYTIKTVSDILK